MRILIVNPPSRSGRLYTLRDEICFQDVRYVPFPLRLDESFLQGGTGKGKWF